MVSSLFESTGVVKYIIEINMVDVNTPAGCESVMVLHYIVVGGSESTIEIVKLSIDVGADVECLDEIIKHKF